MITDLDTLVDRIPDGASVAVAPDYSGCAMAAVRALIRRGARELHLIAVPQAGFQADMLIGAGCVASVETAAITLGEHGFAPRFGEAVKNGDIVLRDALTWHGAGDRGGNRAIRRSPRCRGWNRSLPGDARLFIQ